MKRHPIKTIKGLLEMGSKEVMLTREEAELLVKHYEQLFNWHEDLEKDEYGMD